MKNKIKNCCFFKIKIILHTWRQVWYKCLVERVISAQKGHENTRKKNEFQEGNRTLVVKVCRWDFNHYLGGNKTLVVKVFCWNFEYYLGRYLRLIPYIYTKKLYFLLVYLKKNITLLELETILS